MTTYHIGFTDTLKEYGLEKSAAEELYKEAQIFRSLWSIGKGLAGLVPGTLRAGAKAVKGINTVSRPVVRFLGSGAGVLGGKGLAVRGLSGLGRFAANHPILGALAYTVPTAMFTNKINKDSDDLGEIDTLTPVQREIGNRVSGAGYSGLGYSKEDLDLLGYL